MTPQLAIEIKKYIEAGSVTEQAALLHYLMGWFNPDEGCCSDSLQQATVAFWEALDEATRAARAAEISTKEICQEGTNDSRVSSDLQGGMREASVLANDVASEAARSATSAGESAPAEFRGAEVTSNLEPQLEIASGAVGLALPPSPTGAKAMLLHEAQGEQHGLETGLRIPPGCDDAGLGGAVAMRELGRAHTLYRSPLPAEKTIPQIHQLFYFTSYGVHRSRCWVSIFKHGSKFLIVLADPDPIENDLAPALIDVIEYAATTVKDNFLPRVSPELVTWVLHLRKVVSAQSPDVRETFQMLVFSYLNIGDTVAYTDPFTAIALSRDEVEQLAGMSVRS